MLPTSGYFRGLPCPSLEKGQCNRPHCHFHHSPKKDCPSSSNAEAPSILTSSINVQSEVFQQLVSEAVKKVLIENPHLSSSGLDPTSLVQQTASVINSTESHKNKKKYYPRPPDTPSYNPTPIRELNKRKLSSDFNEDSSSPKVAKYTPASLTLDRSKTDEKRESPESDATDFSSADDDDDNDGGDKQNCDFDILEEVLAEHSQNNKIKVKKKKVKALWKLQFNLNNPDKSVDESSMISDARSCSDQDSANLDGAKGLLHEPVAEKSYFLPPSPVFTSSSDGFGNYNTVVYTKPDSCEDDINSRVKPLENSSVINSLDENSKCNDANEDHSHETAIEHNSQQNKTTDSLSKGHSLLPKVVDALGTPRMSRPNVRDWNPQIRNASGDISKSNSDPLESILQQMDGVLSSQTSMENSATVCNTLQEKSPPKDAKQYKVDLDKEIKSLTSSSSEIKNKLLDDNVTKSCELVSAQKDRQHDIDKHHNSTNKQLKQIEDAEGVSLAQKEVSEFNSSGKIKESLDCNNEESKSNSGESEPDTKGKKTSDDEETMKDLKKSKRKRHHSSDSESEDSYRHRKKKKSHKHRKKYKKRKRRRDAKSGSDKSDVGSDRDENKEEEVDLNNTEASEKCGSEKLRKHKKHRKSKRHHKKYRNKKKRRSRSKIKRRDKKRALSTSSSSSRDRSRSSSRHRGRSSSRSRSRTSSRCRSRSASRERSRSHSSYGSRSNSNEGSTNSRKHRYSSQSSSEENRSERSMRTKRRKRKSKDDNDKEINPETDVEKTSLSIPMPVDPSKIKVEKHTENENVLPIVPDLSIVKTEKEEDSIAIKTEKPYHCSKNTKNTNSTNLSDDTVGKTKLDNASSLEKVETPKSLSNKNYVKSSNLLASPQSSQSKETKKKYTDKERSKHSHERKSSTENKSDAGKQKNSHERRNSKEGSCDRKHSRTSSTDIKKPDHKSSSSEAKMLSRSESTSKICENKLSGSNNDSQIKGMSMFDMVLASIEPSRPKALKEISIFDNVSAVACDSNSSSPYHSSIEEESLIVDKKHSDKISNESPMNRKTSDVTSTKDKHLSDFKSSKVKSHSKSEKDTQSHRSTTVESKSKSSNMNENESKRHRSSSEKSRSGSHHSKSSSNKSSSSRHKNRDHNKGHQEDNDRSVSSSSSHTKKTTESKTRSHTSKHDSKGLGQSHSHGRRHSSSNNEKRHRSDHRSSGSKDHENSSENRKKDSKSSCHESDTNDKIREHFKGSGDKQKKEATLQRKKDNKTTEDSGDSPDVCFSPGKELSDADDSDGYNSPFPDLSVLDEIPQDDWEQIINSNSEREECQPLQDNLEFDDDLDMDNLDTEDPEVMEECLQMFNEYKPTQADVDKQLASKKSKVESKQEPDVLPSKQRIARSTSVGNRIPSKATHELKSKKKTPAQVMMERYQKLKEQQAELLKQLEKQKQQLEEQSRLAVAASSSSSSVVSSRHSLISSSSVSSSSSSSSSSRSKIAPASSSTSLKISPHSTSGTPKRRMSHVPNVTSLLEAKKQIKSLSNVASTSGVTSSTIAHTISKGGKRIAHVPKLETLQRPTITPVFGSKVPPNIRQRYLNSLIDECLKFLGEKEAFNLGLAEEKVCFQRASSRMVYLNLAVNAVKRLRNQQEPSESAQELMESDPMFKENAVVVNLSSSAKPSTSGLAMSPTKDVKPHPVNPNHSSRSHFSVLAVGGQKGSWSIETKKTTNVDNYLKGQNFYKSLKKYILNEQQLEENGYPSPDPQEKGKAIIKVVDSRKKVSPSSTDRYCDRCSVLYTVDKWGFPLSVGPCVHHWGRPYKRRGYAGWETKYSCCGGDLTCDGCCQATTHVSQNFNPNELRGYVRTIPKDIEETKAGVYALDCEMCYTTHGNELTRVTVIDSDGNTVYEQLVKPENPIIDYNTRFSGITENDLEDVTTTIREVQASLLTKFSDKTILIGHSLESDFHALKLIHDTVVDTSIVFPHKMGAPYKRALRQLASEYLKKIIQNDVSGHDSAEDAVTCMHLMQWRVKEDFKGFGQK